MHRSVGCANFKVAASVCILILSWLLLAGQAFAQSTDPAIQNGLAWLQGQIGGSGQLVSEAASLALPMQARSETATTFKALSATPPAALYSAIDSITPDTTEYLARKALARQIAGSADATVLNALVQMQNADGGFGAAAGLPSNPQDTAWALRSLTANRAGTTAAMQALTWLTSNQQANGAWFLSPDGDAVVATALVTQALTAYRQQAGALAALTKARAWLLAQRNASQTWDGDLRTAQAMLAVLPGMESAASVQPAADALRASQRADGSWAGDPYLTAVALCAVWYASQPPIGEVKGIVTDQSTGQPVALATVQLVEDATASTSSGADGSFSLSGLSSGTYTLLVTKPGYQINTIPIQITVGQVLDVGAIAIVPSSTTSNLSGVIRNSSGSPLQNVVVTVDTRTALTDATGVYQITGLSPGNRTVTATLPGYQTVTAMVNFVAGNSYTFSPTLYANGQTPPTTSLQGLVVDATTSSPIFGATVTLNGATQTTDATGKFLFTDAVVGGFTIQVSATGYQTVNGTGTLAAGANDLGEISLSPAPTTARLSGIVQDSSGTPLQDVVVSAGLSTATTDATGTYQITNLSPGDATITASLPGYQTATAMVNFVAGNSYTFSPTLYADGQALPNTSVQGLVVDATTSSPIPGATVTLNGTTQTADATGKFLFTDAVVGGFTIQVSATGYQTVNGTGTLAAGANDLGEISLSPAPTTARLSGVVQDSSGIPLQNVVVSAGTSTAMTDASGAYQITNLSPGDTTITASLSGYQTATTTANLVAGNNYTFSPTLYGNAETAPGTSLQGIVINGSTGAPIASATVVLNGSRQTTDTNGKFLFANTTAGSFAIQISATGYFAINGTGTLAAGVNDLGKIPLSPAPAATKYQTITSAGPLNKIFVGADLSTQIAHTGDTSYEVYPSATIPGDFGTFVVVGSTLYAPRFNSRGTATGNIGSYTPFTLVSQTDVLGAGTSSDPFTVSTIANVGTTGLTILQTDSYVVGQEAFRTDVTITNTTNDPISAILYRAMDCYLGNSDVGYGFVTDAGIGCSKTKNNDPPGRIEEFIPLTNGSNYYEAYYGTVWSAIGTHKPFPDTCACAANQDNGMGLSWTITVPPNSSLTYSNMTVFSPLGSRPLVVTKTADSATALPGDSDGYTITVSNPNADSKMLDSITDTLPDGFVYVANSSTDATTSNPSVAGQMLTWAGPFTLPANSDVTLHFSVKVATSPGTYYNQATVSSWGNSVIPTGQTAPVTINVVNAAIGVGTDEPTYSANAPVNLNADITNSGSSPADLSAVLSIEDDAGQEVITFPVQNLGTLAPGAIVPMDQPWNTASYVAGTYVLLGRVLDAAGNLIAYDRTLFSITAGTAAGTPNAALTVSTDKAQYLPDDRVLISDLLRNLTINAALDDARVELKVFDPSSTLIFSYTHTVGQLPAGALRVLEVPQPLMGAAEGAYTVQATLIGSGQGLMTRGYDVDVELATVTTSYTVLAGTRSNPPDNTPQPIPTLGAPALALMGLLMALAVSRSRRRPATIATRTQTTQATGENK